ncbi:MAG: DUF4867 family protein [Bacilli bacterium]
MLNLSDESFSKYGKKLDIDVSEIISYLNNIELPLEGNVYVASDEKFEGLKEVKYIQEKFFPSIPMQAGYVVGHNILLNATEYHDSIEINVASEDVTLFLGTQDIIKDGVVKSTDLEEVYIKKNEAFVLNKKILHFSPCATSKNGFRVAVLLPKGTNTPLAEKSNDSLYFMNNKWLIAHKESPQAQKGAYVGIIGENRKGTHSTF